MSLVENIRNYENKQTWNGTHNPISVQPPSNFIVKILSPMVMYLYLSTYISTSVSVSMSVSVFFPPSVSIAWSTLLSAWKILI